MSKKPNIVFILSDDQGAWAMRCAGNNDIKTPTLDSLARSGVRFNNFFCASPVCSPARASIMTGTIPSAHGVQDWLRGGNVDSKREDVRNAELNVFASETEPVQYLKDMTTYTDLLAQNGYNCALCGKWHLGDSVTAQHGFEHWMTIARGGCYYMNPDIVREGRIEFAHRYITDVIADDAIETIDALSTDERPFYLSVHFTAPHSPWDREEHPKEFWDMYNDCAFTATPDLPIHKNQVKTAPYGTGQRRRDNLHGYYAAISAMDARIGDIIDKLKQCGKYDDTIIIFTADNGMNLGQHGIWGKGNGTLPMNMYDTSVKVPFIMCGCGIEKGLVQSSLFSHYDIMPTLMDFLALGGEVKQTLVGKSFAGALRGEAMNENGSIIVADEYGPVRMIRSREYKYIHVYPYGPNEFYCLRDDPDEEHNLIDDPAQAERIHSMRAEMEEWFFRYTDPRIDARAEAVAGSGQLCRVGVYAHGRKAHYDAPERVGDDER